MADLKVLMMGGRRCGKTSALASMFDQMINGPTNSIITVADRTVGEIKDGEKQDMLRDKKSELKYFINKNINGTFMVDKAPTKNYWDYLLSVQLPGNASHNMQMRFRDANGEFFDAGGPHHDETMAFVQDCDVFIVIVETPYLMAGEDYENENANIVDSIHTFLTTIDQDGSRKSKQVIFVPIKCEKWIKAKKTPDNPNVETIEDVVKKVEETYDKTIKDLKQNKRTEISIIPIQTAGDIVFEDLRDAYLLINKLTGEKIKCAKEDNETVINRDGKYIEIESQHVLNEDPEAVFHNTSIPRRAPWFSLYKESGKASYRPQNCEQLSLHIIRFMFNKAEDEAIGGIWGKIFKFLFGSLTKEDLQNVLVQLNNNKMIKDSGDGIKIIKTCFK